MVHFGFRLGIQPFAGGPAFAGPRWAMLAGLHGSRTLAQMVGTQQAPLIIGRHYGNFADVRREHPRAPQL